MPQHVGIVVGYLGVFSFYLPRIHERNSAVYPKILCDIAFPKTKFCKVIEERGRCGEKIRSGVVVNVRE